MTASAAAERRSVRYLSDASVSLSGVVIEEDEDLAAREDVLMSWRGLEIFGTAVAHGAFEDHVEIRPSHEFIDAAELLHLQAPTPPLDSVDASAVPGVLATLENADFEHRRSLLIEAIRMLCETALSWNSDWTYNVSKGAATTAIRVLRQLPNIAVLPKIAPDGEGDVLLVWEVDGRKDVAVVEARQIHFIRNAGTPEAEYFENLHLSEAGLPQEFIRVLPRKL